MKLFDFVRVQQLIVGMAFGIQSILIETSIGTPAPGAAIIGILVTAAIVLFCAIERRNECDLVWESARIAADEVVQKKVQEANAHCMKLNVDLRAEYQKMLDQAIAAERGKRPDNDEDMG